MKLAPSLFALALFLLVSSCANDGGSRARETTAAADATAQRVSPLGLGYPDPDRMFRNALDAFRRNDSWTFLSYFAFKDPTGKYFVPTPKEGAEVPDLRQMAPMAQALEHHLASDWVEVNYGNVRSVNNDPPIVEVPMTVDYRFDRLDEDRKNRILAEVNRLITYRQGPSARLLTWEQYRRQLLNLPRAAVRRYVFLDGRWRFDAAWKVDR